MVADSIIESVIIGIFQLLNFNSTIFKTISGCYVFQSCLRIDLHIFHLTIKYVVVGRYEMRYEIQESVISVLWIWHTREDR